MPRARRIASVLVALMLLLVPLAAQGGEGEGSDGGGSAADGAPSEVEQLSVAVAPEPDGQEVALQADLYLPAGEGPHEAVVLAHGFGGSKQSLVAQARDLADQGFVVLAYTARGFGESGGAIHLNDPDYEIADAQALIDLVAQRPEVAKDASGDPRVGVAGASYGGALALMVAGADERVDSVAASITWNDLAQAFFPQAGQGLDEPGPFLSWWASTFYTSTLAAGAGEDPRCGRFADEVCDLFVPAAETGKATPELLQLLREHSPASTLANVQAPVYLRQGMADTLFGTDQADATARALHEAGVPVAVSWFNGGHDAGADALTGASGAGNEGTQSVAGGVGTWLTGTLRSQQPVTAETMPLPAFSYALPASAATGGPGGDASQESAGEGQGVTSQSYPPMQAGEGAETASLPLSPAGPTTLINPPGGVPAATTVLPGAGGLIDEVPTYALSALPGQSVAFDTEPLAEDITVVGEPEVSLEVTSTGEGSTLFVSLWEVQGQSATLPRRLVAPVQAQVSPGEATEIEVALPGGTWQMREGSTWRVLVTATEAAYAGPQEVRTDQVELATPELRVPIGAGGSSVGPSVWDGETLGVVGALLAVLGAAAGGGFWRRRSLPHTQPEWADVPLMVDGLVKAYPDGHRAVDDVTWRAERGQVLGLLGPNGAGKTTTLRMVMGLIKADSGSVHVLGEPVVPGAPVLARVGALIEGPGFLPHVTGRANLHAFWAATGRPMQDACFDEVLEVAALGEAIDRPVRSYSQGMRQRLGIAQAMLGMPEVLILDEPTNGLDPPQIAAMRPMLARYAAGGRTVVISSHLLAEVEMTCSHVVVMHAGAVLAAGSVDELGIGQGRTLESFFLSTIADAGDDSEDGDHRINQVRDR